MAATSARARVVGERIRSRFISGQELERVVTHLGCYALRPGIAAGEVRGAEVGGVDVGPVGRAVVPRDGVRHPGHLRGRGGLLGLAGRLPVRGAPNRPGRRRRRRVTPPRGQLGERAGSRAGESESHRILSSYQNGRLMALRSPAPALYYVSTVRACKEVVHYQTISPKSLAKAVLEEGGWSNLVCSREDPQKNVDFAVLFLGSKLQSSDISKDKQDDPALADTLKLSFTSSEFSMAFPYVAMSDDDKLEKSLLSGFAENCNYGFEGNHVTYTETCTVSGEDLKKHQSMDSIHDLVMSRVGNDPSGQTDLIVFCSGGFKGLDNAQSEGELLSELVAVLKKSEAKYTVLYASQPYGSLENPSNLPLGRYLAEETNTTKAGLGKCDGECIVKSTLLEGSFVGIVLLIILISGLKCMMGIDTPSRFQTPQES